MLKKHNYSNIILIGIVLISCLFVTGFNIPKINIPSREQLRKNLQKEIDKIKALTPEAKRHALWLKKKLAAQQALEKAKLEGAQRYAIQSYNKALYYLTSAINYAKAKAYLKAIYLAKKSREMSDQAQRLADQRRVSLKAKVDKQLKDLKTKIDSLFKKIASNPRLLKEKARILLAYQDLVHALHLEQFDQIKTGITKIEHKIRMLLNNKSIIDSYNTSNNKRNNTILKSKK